jgi:hypothetical protein
VHWAVRVNGGDRKGNEHAENWEGGKKSSRRCLGVIECDNPLCKTLIRPHTAPEGINKQLTEPCKCGAELSHRRCNIISYLWRWSDGIHYENGGFHTHRRPTHILHLLSICFAEELLHRTYSFKFEQLPLPKNSICDSRQIILTGSFQ